MSSRAHVAQLALLLRSLAPAFARIGFAMVLGGVGCAEPQLEQPVAARVDDLALADGGSGADWLGFGRTYDEQRYSPLTQIDDSNVGDLKVDWVLDLPTDRGLASTPLVVDGVLYFIGSMNIVRAVDATSGDHLWTYDPRVRE